MDKLAFVPVSFLKGRVPSVSKVREDAQRMMLMARYVITLDKNGKVVDSPTPLDDVKENSLDCLVVVAPVIYRGVHIPYAIVLEVGFNRFVPYAQAEYQVRERGKKVVRAVKERQVVANASPQTLLKLMPNLFETIQMEVDARIKKWKRLTLSHVRGYKKFPYEVPDLVYVRLPDNVPMLHYGAMLYDVTWRLKEDGNLRVRAKQIRKWLDEFILLRKNHKTDSGYFLEGTVKRSASMASLADRLKLFQMYHMQNSHYVNVLERMIHPHVHSAQRKLLRQVRTLHKVPKPKRNYLFERLRKKYAPYEHKLQALWKLHTVIDSRRNRKRKVHAKDCLVVGVAASVGLQMAYMERLHKVSDKTDTEQDADIPF